jgi:hypothetical protein
MFTSTYHFAATISGSKFLSRIALYVCRFWVPSTTERGPNPQMDKQPQNITDNHPAELEDLPADFTSVNLINPVA